ncbi:MAG: hypothetical protein MZV70_05265 [Desulfobacterales bacterium]|nr:hypothetical protein [Desulfobacterales bacterium]
MNTFFACFEMFTVGSNYPNRAIGLNRRRCREGLPGVGDHAGVGTKHGVSAQENPCAVDAPAPAVAASVLAVASSIAAALGA